MARKPVIFIPGFAASELHAASSKDTLYPPPFLKLVDPAKKAALLAKLETIAGVEAGLPIASVLGGVVKEAQSIYNTLHGQFGYDVSFASHDFLPIGWDWRQGIDSADTIQRIADALDFLSPARDGNVVAILHSTGGPVLRAFLEQQPQYLACFEQVLAFGAPWAGTLESLHAATQGVSAGFLFVKLITPDEGQGLMSRAQAAYDIFPDDVALGLFRDQNGAAAQPLVDQSWIKQAHMQALAATAHPPFAQEFDDLPVTNVCGWGADTLTTASINKNTRDIDFAPMSKEAGDGTVPFVSSSWVRGAGVRTMALPIGAYATGFLPKIHSQIWDSPPVLQLFHEVLDEQRTRLPFLCAAADSDDYLDVNKPLRLRVSACAADGAALPNLLINVNLDGKLTPVPMLDDTRGMIAIGRANIHHNIGSDLYRFNVEFTWDGGSDKRAVLIHAL